MQINIYLQEGGATAGATEPLNAVVWGLLLAILAGIAMAWVNRQPGRPAIRRGRRGNYPVENPVLQVLRGLLRRTGLLLLRAGRPQAQPGHPRCERERRPHPRNNNPRRSAFAAQLDAGELPGIFANEDEMPPLEDIGVKAFMDDLFVVDPYTRSVRLVSEQNEPHVTRTMVRDNGAPYVVPGRRNLD
ncbi:hypothetical protein DFH06DRAFT_1141839 [Mycena polygramma]|nr:hypothetical protein DFH06DRAFT_1141839 [Mycena polygramma]